MSGQTVIEPIYNYDMEITLLSKEQIWKEPLFAQEQLEIFKKHDPECNITDLAVLTGAYYIHALLVGSPVLRVRVGNYWTKTHNSNGDYFVCVDDGSIDDDKYNETKSIIRPVLVIKDQKKFDLITSNKRFNDDGICEVEFGEYPQYAASLDIQEELEEQYQEGKLIKTGNSYSFNTIDSTDKTPPYNPIKNDEYEYEGSKYIRTCAFFFGDGDLSNYGEYKDGDIVWVKVSPVTWLVDEKTKTLVSKNGLLSGIPMFFVKPDHEEDLEDYNKSDMNNFLNRYMLRDLKQSVDFTKQITNQETRKRNPYGFDFDAKNEEDIIRGSIESNVPVFLHGQSSDGKSSRVKQIDPDCVIIYMRNATPESLVGKSVYDPTSMELIDIKPSWLVKLEKKCEDEPDKNHILFFDEISNALPSVQGMAFNIILDREVNGKWTLPENARIVAAGNELKDSLAANRIAEPLFNRFAHVYINTNFKDWLIWASENGIHPAICAYIAYSDGESLRSDYTGESPNADPRKWEMASRMLYATNRPEMIRSLVGERITEYFIEFCKQKVITLEDVLNDNYTGEDIRSLDTAEKYATAMALLGVDEENIEKVRKVVEKLGREVLATFDIMWTKGREERLERIAEIKLTESSNTPEEGYSTIK